jgi:PAS domain S-box-containing protein
MRPSKQKSGPTLRERAEAALSEEPETASSLSPEGIQSLIHDLRVHQIELEMQNDELRGSRNALEKARDEYALLYNRSPVGYFSLDASGIIRRANQTFLDMLGEGAAPVGKSFAGLLKDTDRDIFLGRFSALFRRPEDKQLDLTIDGPGSPLYLRLTLARQEGTNELLVAASDVSEQHRNQEALRQAELLWSETFQAMSDGVWILDLEGRVLRYNAASERLVGKPGERLEGCHCFNLMHDSDHRIENCPYLRMMGSNAHETQTVQSGERWFEISVDPLRDGQERLIGSVHIIKDITARKKIEEDLSKILEEKKLLLREVHHRIKNNMNIIASLLSIQAAKMEDGPAGEALEEARSRVLSMMLIYDKLYRSEDFMLVSSSEYLAALIGEIGQQFKSTGSVRLEHELEDFPLDSAKLFPLGIILNELVTNAFKYAFDGQNSGTIRITLKRNNARACMSVQDDGKGLPPELDLRSSPGFGFMLVRGLVEQLGGSLRLPQDEDNAGIEGSRFLICFPSQE